mmetsp:Transcript_10929/g.23148  ORF Transcript_10929/g.23148 Transcript_10929/m.23148 type:complete len:80 (-) Transcript_10929:275-514(-)
MVLPHNKRNFEAVKHLPRDETITYYGIFRGRQRECEIAGGTNVQFRPAYGQPSETFLLRLRVVKCFDATIIETIEASQN